MSANEAAVTGTPLNCRPLTRAEALRLGCSYVAAYNDRDLDAMLALQDENVVSYPARLVDQQRFNGHAGVRAWWQAMVDSGRWYHVEVRDIRQLGPDRVVLLGEIAQDGEPLGPWSAVVRYRDGLITESRTYLTDTQLLDTLGLLT